MSKIPDPDYVIIKHLQDAYGSEYTEYRFATFILHQSTDALLTFSGDSGVTWTRLALGNEPFSAANNIMVAGQTFLAKLKQVT